MPPQPRITDHLRPTAEIAPDALLPGDPAQALALAQHLLEAPRMANHTWGLWGYTGLTAGGLQLTIQSTGLGGPSVAVALEELARLGVRRAIRLGTARALASELEPGSELVAARAIAGDGTSAALGAGARVDADAALTASLCESAGAEAVTVASQDLHYEPRTGASDRTRREAGARAIDLGTAAALALARRRGLALACGLVIVRGANGERLEEDRLEASSLRLGRAAAAALAAGGGAAQAPPSGVARLP